MIWSEAHVEHLRLWSRSCKVKQRVMCFFVRSPVDMSCFQWLTEFILHSALLSFKPLDLHDRPATENVFEMTKAQCHFRHALFLWESKAQISCTVRFFLSILYRRHSTGPSALINTSRREWLFLKMWRWRTCQFMPLYECFGMTACSASQCFCSSC